MRPCRRAVLKRGLGLAVGLTFVPRSLGGQDDPASLRPQDGDLLVKQADAALQPLTPADIPVSDFPTLAWALDTVTNRARNGSRLNLVALMRFDPDALSQATRPHAAEGVVAYSALCTHAGCDLTDWLDDRELLSCDCHSALFDPKDAGRVIDGPARWALPALTLKIVEGRLAIAKGFASAIKFESP